MKPCANETGAVRTVVTLNQSTSWKESDLVVKAVASIESKLKYLYLITSFLSVFMVIWILVFPSSWLMGRSKLHDWLINETIVKTYDGTQIPPGTITKYAGHSLIQFTHILPGAMWAGAIPFQLNPSIRRKYKNFHKITGYAFLISSLMMSFGIYVIFDRNLTFHNDYKDIPKAGGGELAQMKIQTMILTAWFAFTVIAAVFGIRSRNINFHRNFAIRHVASGIWIAVQRIIVIFCQRAGIVHGPSQMRSLFWQAATVGVVVTVGMGEYAIRLLKEYDWHVKESSSKQYRKR